MRDVGTIQRLFQIWKENRAKRREEDSHCSPDDSDSELSHDEVLARLTERSKLAFANLTNAAPIQGHPGYVWARRGDVDALLAELTVAVGLEARLIDAEVLLRDISNDEYLLGGDSRVCDWIAEYFGEPVEHDDDLDNEAHSPGD